jgi:hypothetical protein
MPEFLSRLTPTEIVWGAFKVVGVDDRGNTVSRRPKFIFVKYLPSEVPTMRRARAGGHKGAIKQVLDAHIDVEVHCLSCLCFFSVSDASLSLSLVRLKILQSYQRKESFRNFELPGVPMPQRAMNSRIILHKEAKLGE